LVYIVLSFQLEFKTVALMTSGSPVFKSTPDNHMPSTYITLDAPEDTYTYFTMILTCALYQI
jgi:hypothetical protein